MSHEHFEVGEIAIYVNSVRCPEYNGTECEIIGPLDWGIAFNRGMGCNHMTYGYRTRAHDGQTFRTAPEFLRKKRPPPLREPVSTWDDVIVWRPKTKEIANV